MHYKRLYRRHYPVSILILVASRLFLRAMGEQACLHLANAARVRYPAACCAVYVFEFFAEEELDDESVKQKRLGKIKRKC